ncbi:hypothetical protein [Dysgonomonas sp. BGC7]|uniref:hypothetical protein n=1 Tax=Dysgonomonas sp. BGC7 TaxID=1658008 RepID=UPI000AB25186|nr:hypothetical protein [Dysgonomonas sp. BGC7]MBD8387110.1 hypothetical protein [Dysgonomonas sp. BGC7]
MPLVKIELKKGQTKEFLSSLMDCTIEAIIEVLVIPDNDRISGWSNMSHIYSS